jgi:lysyl-tRNA synthetase class 2
MLEFYEAYSDYQVLMDWNEQLLPQVAREVTGSSVVPYGEQQIDFGKFRRLSLRDAIREHWPKQAGAAPSLDEVNDRARERAIVERYNKITTPDGRYTPVGVTGHEEPGVLLAALFESVAEDELVQPTIVYDFPLSVSPLAKNKADEPDWVERFEIFAAGMEIANGYSELNDPEEQRRRFEMQLRERERGDVEAHAMDEDYIRALEYGMPPTAGEGIGIDRVTMLLTNSQSIRDVILFPLLRPEQRPASAAEAPEPHRKTAEKA